MSWHKVQRGKFDEILAHDTKPVWIVHREAIGGNPEHWAAYKAVAPIPKGRTPWSVDNRSLSKPAIGFFSLAEAMAAGEAV